MYLRRAGEIQPFFFSSSDSQREGSINIDIVIPGLET